MFTVAEQPASDPGSLNAYFDASHELLHTIADVLDIRSVFPACRRSRSECSRTTR